MLDIKEIRLFILRNGYLLIVAAWLFTFAFLFNNYWSYYSSPHGVQRSLENDIHSRQESFEQLAADTAFARSLFNGGYTAGSLSSVYTKDYFVFALDSAPTGYHLAFWSTNTVQPPLDEALRPGVSFRKLANGYYVMLVHPLGEGRTLVGLLPVKEEYAISNEYLGSQFYGRPAIGREYTINTRPPGLPVLDAHDTILFYLHYDPAKSTASPSLMSVVLLTLGVICVLIFINLFATLMARKLTPIWGFLFLLAVVIVFRVLMYRYPFPIDLSTLNLFQPTIYAKDEVFRSLGDLLLNVLLTFWLILFFRQHVRTIHPPVVRKQWQSRLIIGAAGLVMFIVGQFLLDLIRSLVIDSKISYDVTDFFSLNEYSVIGSMTLGFIAITFLFFSQIVNYLLNQLTDFQYRSKYIALLVVGLVWLAFRFNLPDFSASVVLMVWLLAYVIILDLLELRLSQGSVTLPFILWMLLMTVTTSATLIYYNNQKELEVRLRVAENLSKQRDPYLETLLIDVGDRLSNDPYVQQFFLTPDRTYKSKLVRTLQEKYFSRYLNRFNVTFWTFDADGQPIYNTSQDTLQELNARIMAGGSLPHVMGRDLYYEERSFNDYSYLGKKQFTGPGDFTSGYLFFEVRSQPESSRPDRLYPELLIEGGMRDPDVDQRDKYSTAVYDKGVLVAHYNNYPFKTNLEPFEIPAADVAYEEEGNNSLLYYHASKDKLIVVVKPVRTFLEFITLFAYMFCLFLLIIGLYSLFDLLIKARMRLANLRSIVRPSIRTKVQATIIFAVAFAFMALGLATILFFIGRYRAENAEKLSNTVHIIAREIENTFQQQREFDEVVGVFDSIFVKDLSEAIGDIASEHNVDVNVYDTNGWLQLTAQPLMVEKGLISPVMNPLALYALQQEHKVQFIQEEHIGEMKFISGYIPLRNHGNVFAYLNVPYFATQTELDQQISNFLVALININAFIFLIAGLLVLLISNTITKSFSLITEKLRNVTLGRHNEPIEWDKEDEIGLLVKEYNKMVEKLEVSAAMLAKSEREGAWREMARQVAHEIKNPLTPMKLSIQYLQRAIANDSPDVKALSRNVANTLVEQIEHLSNIASDFAAFAQISTRNNEVFSLGEVLQSVTALYMSSPECHIYYERQEQPYLVYADKTQINRLFTNLLQNAVQAIPEGREGHVAISMKEDGPDHVLVEVIDNGSGIPTEVQPKIFVPNFTTKSSGTGLGLAMCKNIVELAGGEIWFKTSPGIGTTFFVRLPLVKHK
ncbi:sensor histidine kinase [Chitinophaga lutea]